MDIEAVAKRWADVWSRAWPDKDVDAIVELYSDDANYRALAFRAPDQGPSGVRSYLTQNFEVENEIECRFGEPLIGPDRAAVEWWASWIEDGEELTLAGTTLLRFDPNGLVVDHRDYWNEVPGRKPPYTEW